jgi:hypothetical protein
MKLSALSVAILKNFALINNSIYIDEVGVFKTKTPNASNIIGVAKIDEELPELSIYSLDEFLGSMSLFDPENIEFEFTDSYIKMREGNMKINYRLSDPEHILTKCKKSKLYNAFKDFDATFKLSEAQLSSIQKAARILKADACCIDIEDGEGKISLINSELPMANSFELEVSGTGTGEAKIFVDNLIIMPSNYTCNVASNKVVKFSSDDVPVYYMLATASGL